MDATNLQVWSSFLWRNGDDGIKSCNPCHLYDKDLNLNPIYIAIKTNQ